MAAFSFCEATFQQLLQMNGCRKDWLDHLEGQTVNRTSWLLAGLCGMVVGTLLLFSVSISQRTVEKVAIDLQDANDLAALKATWKWGHGLVPGEGNGGFVDGHVNSPARLTQFDDSAWQTLTPTGIRKARGSGFSMGWYRITITLPKMIDDFQIDGSKVYFETTVNDYGEVWVDGKCDHAFGRSGKGGIAGFNRRNRILISEKAAPGATHVIAILAINGPIAEPVGGYFLRYARIDLLKPKD